MILWDIKHNGYPISQCRGKNNAVAVLKKRLEWEGVTHQKWEESRGDIYCYTDKGVFLIEENHD